MELAGLEVEHRFEQQRVGVMLASRELQHFVDILLGLIKVLPVKIQLPCRELSLGCLNTADLTIALRSCETSAGLLSPSCGCRIACMLMCTVTCAARSRTQMTACNMRSRTCTADARVKACDEQMLLVPRFGTLLLKVLEAALFGAQHAGTLCGKAGDALCCCAVRTSQMLQNPKGMAPGRGCLHAGTGIASHASSTRLPWREGRCGWRSPCCRPLRGPRPSLPTRWLFSGCPASSQCTPSASRRPDSLESLLLCPAKSLSS